MCSKSVFAPAGPITFKDMGSMHAWIGGRMTTLCVVVLHSLIYVRIHSYSKAVLPSPGRHSSSQVRALMGSRTYCMGTDTCIRLPPDRILTHIPLCLELTFGLQMERIYQGIRHIP